MDKKINEVQREMHVHCLFTEEKERLKNIYLSLLCIR